MPPHRGGPQKAIISGSQEALATAVSAGAFPEKVRGFKRASRTGRDKKCELDNFSSQNAGSLREACDLPDQRAETGVAQLNQGLQWRSGWSALRNRRQDRHRWLLPLWL